MIQLKNVHKSYGQTKVLKGIDLQIQDQDDVVILGPSGSGKSTLLNVLSGLEKVDEGHILIQGQDLAQLTDTQLTAFRREKIAFIFQLLIGMQFQLYLSVPMEHHSLQSFR